MLKIAVAWTQMHIGTGTSFLEDVHTELPHMEVKWLASLQTYLKHINGYFELDDPGVLPLQRENDDYIMDRIIRSHRFHTKQIIQLNLCRLYLKVATISDITMPDGKTIDPSFEAGEPSLFTPTSNLLWPYQVRPPESAWKLWKRAYFIWSNEDGVLQQPLGRWTVPPSKQRMKWTFYVDEDSNSLYHRTDEGVRAHFASNDDMYPCNSYDYDDIPDTANPVHAVEEDSKWKVTHPYFNQVPPAPATNNVTFEDYLQSLDSWETNLFLQYHTDSSYTDIIEHLRSTPRAASDGSVWKPHAGAFGWILRIPNDTSVQCASPAYGYKISSYRAEAYGILSYLRFLYRLHEYWGVSNFPRCSLLCDNLSLVNRLSKDKPPPPPEHDDVDHLDDDSPYLPFLTTPPKYSDEAVLTSEWDIISMIRKTLHDLSSNGTRVLFEHIKSHQDNNTEYVDLSPKAQLNVDADRIATEYQEGCTLDRTKAPRLPTAQVQLQLNDREGFEGGTVTHNFKSAIRFAESAPTLRKYIIKRNEWPTAVFDEMVDWEAHSQALSRNNHHRVHIIKLIHDILPTNHIARYFVTGREPHCPSCDCEREERDHVFQCPHPARATWRRTALQEIRKVCTRVSTSPGLLDLLLDSLEALFQGTIINQDNYDPRYHLLIAQQQAIGWRQMFSGRFSKEWAKLQHEHLVSQNLSTQTQNGTTWLVQVISSIWTQWMKVWDIRNKVIHGHDNTTREQAKRRILKIQLEEIYALRDQVCPHHESKLFPYPTIEAHLERSNNQIDNWLKIHSSAIRESVKRAEERAREGVPHIYAYFRQVNRTRNQPPIATRRRNQANTTNPENSTATSTQRNLRPTNMTAHRTTHSNTTSTSTNQTRNSRSNTNNTRRQRTTRRRHTTTQQNSTHTNSNRARNRPSNTNNTRRRRRRRPPRPRNQPTVLQHFPRIT